MLHEVGRTRCVFESGVAWKGCYGATGVSGWNVAGRVEGRTLPFLVLPNQSFNALGVVEIEPS